MTARRMTPRRIFWLLAAVAVLSAVVIAKLLFDQRAAAVASGEKLGLAFAQLADEQTSRTLQFTEQTLQFAEVRLAAARDAGIATEGEMRAEFRSFLQNRPFLRAIWVLDEHGVIVFDSDTGNIGVDLGDRRYFTQARENPAARFAVGRPFLSRTTGGWTIPATWTLLYPDGRFAGVIVGALDPLFFDRVWKSGCAEGCAIGLLRDDGMLVMRSPLEGQTLGRSVSGGRIDPLLRAGAPVGSLEMISPIDGVPRLFSYRRLDAFPSLVIMVAQDMSRVLADWSHVVRVTVVGWLGVVASVAALLGLLVRQWNTRIATQERYRKLFEAVPYPMALLERDTRRFVEVNDATTRQYGYSREELLGMSSNDFYAPEDLPKVQEIRRSSPGTTLIPVMRHRRKDGSTIEIESYVHPLDIDGRPAILATALDVTERVRTEREREAATERLREAEARYRLLFESVPYAVIVNDRETLRLLEVNDEAAALYRQSREELLTRTVDEFYPPEDLAKILEGRSHFSYTATRTLRGFRHRRKDGSQFDVEMAIRLVDFGGRPAAMTIVVDVTDHIRAEEARRAAEEQLRQSQKMETVGQLTGGVAHDFNNILTVILANTDALLEERDIDPAVVKRLEQISNAVLRASELTQQLLSFSRKQPLRPRRTDVNELVASTGKLLQRALGEHIELEAVLDDGLWDIDIDRAQLETALVNLCVNARDAMPNGGRLLIETRNTVLAADSPGRPLDVAPGDYVLLSVTDNGTGMSPETKARVFEPFFTTKEVGRGTGLGLSMVYGFVKQSNGHIALESEPGRGTSFHLYLPRATGSEVPAAAQESKPIAGGNEHILVVEDEPHVRGSVVLQLRALGYAVSEAADGAAGLALLKSSDRPIDLLLTDVVMPGPLNGKALADEASRALPGLKVVFMSGYSDNVLTRDGQLPADVLLLSKPFRRADLAATVRQALDGGATRGGC